jgi:hypothetical protein
MPKSNASGKQGYFEYGGTQLYIKSWKGTITTKYADTTDSADYDSTSGLVWNSQLPVSAKFEGEIEGNYDLNGNTDTMIGDLIDGTTTPVTVELGITATEAFGYGTMQVSEFAVETPIEDTVTFTAKVMTSGRFVLGAAP